MPRPARTTFPGVPVHVVHRGIDRRTCFRNHSDFCDYWRLMFTNARAHACAVHAYAFMTNHVHLLVTPGSGEALSGMMKSVAQVYAQRFNRQTRRTGPLWEGRYRQCTIFDDHYLMMCYRYIELNPVRAGICNLPGEYLWSSHRCNVGGVADDLVTPHPSFLALGTDEYVALFASAMTEQELGAIRHSAKTGRALGANLFSRQSQSPGTVP